VFCTFVPHLNCNLFTRIDFRKATRIRIMSWNGPIDLPTGLHVELWFRSRHEETILLISEVVGARPVLEPTPPTTRWVFWSPSPWTKGPGRETYHLRPFSLQVQNVWGFAATSPVTYVFMAYTGTAWARLTFYRRTLYSSNEHYVYCLSGRGGGGVILSSKFDPPDPFL